MVDGFESSVAQRMPQTKTQTRSEKLTSLREVARPEAEAPATAPETAERPAAARLEPVEKVPRPLAPKAEAPPEGGDVLRIVGQLKGQLLALETTKRALERELSTARRQVEHLAADNKALRGELESAAAAQAELLRLREENALLDEETADVLSRLEGLRSEGEESRERLAALAQENQAAGEELARLRLAASEGEMLRIKAEFLEKEKGSLSAENTQLARECEVLKDERDGLFREAASLKKSLKEIRESLLMVRDSARSDYYDLT